MDLQRNQEYLRGTVLMMTIARSSDTDREVLFGNAAAVPQVCVEIDQRNPIRLVSAAPSEDSVYSIRSAIRRVTFQFPAVREVSLRPSIYRSLYQAQ